MKWLKSGTAAFIIFCPAKFLANPKDPDAARSVPCSASWPGGTASKSFARCGTGRWSALQSGVGTNATTSNSCRCYQQGRTPLLRVPQAPRLCAQLGGEGPLKGQRARKGRRRHPRPTSRRRLRRLMGDVGTGSHRPGRRRRAGPCRSGPDQRKGTRSR